MGFLHWLLSLFKGVQTAPAPIPPPMPEPAPQPQISPLVALYEAAVSNLGKHLTLNNAVPEEVGCVEALSFILKSLQYPVPPQGLEGINALIAWLLANGFVESPNYVLGCLITAHKPSLEDATYAHCGIVLKYGIASNTSANGLWQENYSSISNWLKYFGNAGSVTRYFIPTSAS